MVTAKKIAAHLYEIIAQECDCVPLWHDRPVTSMTVMRIRRRVDDLLADAWMDALEEAAATRVEKVMSVR